MVRLTSRQNSANMATSSTNSAVMSRANVADVTARFRSFLRNTSRLDSWRGASPLLHAVADELHWLLSVTAPVRLKPISDALRIEIQIEAGQERPRTMGTLRPVPGGFVATIFAEKQCETTKATTCGRSAEPRLLGPRERFTLAHEIGHSLFFVNEDKNGLPRRVTPNPISGSSEHRREEGLCNDFAGALLIPGQALASCSRPPSPTLLRTLTDELEVSMEPLLRRALYDWEIWERWSFVVINASSRTFRVLHGARVPPKARHRLIRELRDAKLTLMTWADACAEVEHRIAGQVITTTLLGAQSAWLMCEP